MRLPATFQSERPYRLLELGVRSHLGNDCALFRMVAVYLYVQLWVDLALECQATNRVGWLTDAGAALFENRCLQDGLPSPNGGWLPVLEQAALLIRRETGYECPNFNYRNQNEDCAGNWIAHHLRAVRKSAFVRNQHRIQEGTMALSVTLDGRFNDRNGNRIERDELFRVMNLVRSLDAALQMPERGYSEAHWPQGLVEEACEVLRKFSIDDKTLTTFCSWISLNRDSTALPRPAEAMLRSWKAIIQLKAESDRRRKAHRTFTPLDQIQRELFERGTKLSEV